MDINHISVSRKKAYDQCQQLYKYRYHLKLASPKEEPFYFVYGTIVHKIAELYVEGRGKIPIEDITRKITSGEIPIEEHGDQKTFCPDPIPEEYAKKLHKHVKAIKNLTDKIGTEGDVEHEFKLDLDPPNNKCVVGFIDRLILKGEKDESGNIVKPTKAFIIDYKTTKKGKFRVNAQTVTDDLQLKMYARVVQKTFGLAAEDIKAALFYLEGENLVGAQFSQEALDGVEEELKKAFHRIETADPDKVWGNVGWHCKNCDYSTICPFYKGDDQAQHKWDGSLDTVGLSGWGE